MTIGTGMGALTRLVEHKATVVAPADAAVDEATTPVDGAADEQPVDGTEGLGTPELADAVEETPEVPDLAAVATPAPGATPVGSFAYLTGPDGIEAWIVEGDQGDPPVGYLRDISQPGRAVEIDDADAWAQIVDHLALEEQPVPEEDTVLPTDQEGDAEADPEAGTEEETAAEGKASPAAAPTLPKIPTGKLRACSGEDDAGPCRWDASKTGNGKGKSFTSVPDGKGGTVAYYDDGTATSYGKDGTVTKHTKDQVAKAHAASGSAKPVAAKPAAAKPAAPKVPAKPGGGAAGGGAAKKPVAAAGNNNAAFNALHPRGPGGKFAYKNDSGKGAISSGTKDVTTKDDGKVHGRVSAAQQALVKAGFLDPKAGRKGKAVDGFFGPKTAAAVLAFQKKNKLPVTGKLDPATLKALGGTKTTTNAKPATKKKPAAKKPAASATAASRAVAGAAASAVAGAAAGAPKKAAGKVFPLADWLEGKAAIDEDVDAEEGDAEQTGIMIALMVPEGDAADLVVDHPHALPSTDLHVTLAYLGDTTEVEDQGAFVLACLEAMRETAELFDEVVGEVSGLGRFTQDGGDVFYLSYDASGLEDLRHQLFESLDEADIEPARDHGFTPHMTLTTLLDGEDLPFKRATPRAMAFDRLTLCFGDARIEVPLTGAGADEELGVPLTHTDSTAPSANGDGVATLTGKAFPFGGKKAKPAAAGDLVSWSGGKGKVDLVVSTGKVPGVDSDIEGTKSEPVARISVYNADGKPSGDKAAVKVSSLKKLPPFMFGGGKKSTPAETLVSMLAEHHEHAADTDGTPASALAVKAVFERGLASWPGAACGVERESWALGRTKAYLATVEGYAVPNYSADRDLLPEGHELATKQAPHVQPVDDDDDAEVFEEPGKVEPEVKDGQAVVDATELQNLLASLRETA
jgi:peptidoglycan hydrolase-like protein with peptidoglycan-binding domain/2'-5' RNA ligase